LAIPDIAPRLHRDQWRLGREDLALYGSLDVAVAFERRLGG
jgi:hypothetical protein